MLILFISWPFIEKQIAKTEYYPILQNMKMEIQSLTENPHVSAAIDTISTTIDELTGKINSFPKNKDGNESNQVNQQDLAVPTDQVFSIYNIILGESKEEVEKQLGAPQRSSMNEYGTNWFTYHDHYRNFIMVSYDSNNTVDGLFTNQDLISSAKGIKLGTPKEMVYQQLGEPLNEIRKGLVYYKFENNRDYDVFRIDNSYITIFYDKHKNNTVTAIQIINKDLEQNKKDFYSEGSQQLKEGFEYQLFDLTNADRVKHNLSVLEWDGHVKETARKHSNDMAEENYFSHTNLEGQSPFDRMSEDDIFFTVAGENLATGQFSSIFAHEGLMNSLGHRENILRPEYELLGVGVAFNDESQPYYTENFLRK
ncbi:CAP domain-containing protein [Bacillus sp. FJAT-49705]|uniref:CAP domain-containing protein n=2 Tax=Cytobacillus citreus TaxID=2833586 RepID=A0ABS5NQ64_9BACI|nr:CAP domain-containing protein [Cytobacillus citreus]